MSVETEIIGPPSDSTSSQERSIWSRFAMIAYMIHLSSIVLKIIRSRHSAAIMVTNMDNNYSSMAYLLSRLIGLPLIYDIMDLDPDDSELSRLIRVRLALSSGSLFFSESQRAYVNDNYKGLPPSVTIPPILPKCWSVERSERAVIALGKVREKYGLADKHVIGYFGHSWYVQGEEMNDLPLVVRSFKQVLLRVPDSILILAGITEEDRINELLREYKLESRVVRIDRFELLSDEHLGLMMSCDVLMMLSRADIGVIARASRHKFFYYLLANKWIVATKTEEVEGYSTFFECLKLVDNADIESVCNAVVDGVNACFDGDISEDYSAFYRDTCLKLRRFMSSNLSESIDNVS